MHLLASFRFWFGLLVALCMVGSVSSRGEEARKTVLYKVFPETISPDGTLCLAWGEQAVAGAEQRFVEIPYSETLNPQDFDVQDYVMPVASVVKPKDNKEPVRKMKPLALPGVRYFSGIDGHEKERGLSYAWSPDSKAVFVVYETERGFITACHVDLTSSRVTELSTPIEVEGRKAIREKFGREEEEKCTLVYLSRIGLPAANTLALDLSLSDPAAAEGNGKDYSFRMRFKLEMAEEKPSLKPVASRLLWEEDLTADIAQMADETLEAELSKAWKALVQATPSSRLDTLNKEQARWLEQRNALKNVWHKAGFTRHRIEQLSLRADE